MSQTTHNVCVRTYLLHIDLYVFLQVIAVQVEDQVVDKVVSIADNDQRELVSQFDLLRGKGFQAVTTETIIGPDNREPLILHR